jgi:hypothetical protein
MSTFQHVSNIGHKQVLSNLEDNLKSFLDWSFLNIGSYVNVTIPTSGIEGGGFHQLKPATEPSATTNKVWGGVRKDWVYESGIPNQSIINISGIYLNNTFLPAPTGSGNYGYSINYPLGQISFSSAVAASSKVELNYSYRYVQVYKANENSWWKELQQQTYNPANNKSQGDSSITANHRIQMPCIIIEPIARTVLVPRELGSSTNNIIQDVFLHIFTENPTQRNTLLDILLMQKDKTLSLYDCSMVVKNNVFLLDYKGQINPSGLNYDQLYHSDEYRQKWCVIKDANISETNNISHNVYNSIVRWSVEIFA